MKRLSNQNLLGVRLGTAIALWTAIAAAAAVGQTLPTTKSTDDGAGWGPSRNGLQVRLLPERTSIPQGEPVVLRVELRNVARNTVRVPAPHVLPIIAAGDGGAYPRDHGRNFVVTAEPASAQTICILWAPRELTKNAASEVIVLEPGQNWVLRIVPCKADEPARAVGATTAPATTQRRQCADFAYSRFPGKYRLRATFTVADHDGAVRKYWTGMAQSEPVEIEVIPATATAPAPREVVPSSRLRE